jgi:hypothetical protein
MPENNRLCCEKIFQCHDVGRNDRPKPTRSPTDNFRDDLLEFWNRRVPGKSILASVARYLGRMANIIFILTVMLGCQLTAGCSMSQPE